MKMETVYELDSASELPPIPVGFDAMEDSGSCPFVSAFHPTEALAPFPHSDFSPSAFSFSFFSDLDLLHLQPCAVDSFLLDSPPLSLLNRHLAESTHLDALFHGGFPDPATSSFLHMPSLHAVEQTATPFPCLPPVLPVEHAEKRRRFGVDAPPRTLESFVNGGCFPMNSPSSTSGSPARQTMKARDRRRKIAEKTRSLEKLMPWEKKMDMATLLEEAHRYIKFLQAQIAVLRWMPLESVFSGGFSVAGGGGEADLLRVLNRQQILQVIANSSGVQTTLSTRRCCVFSHEQLLSLKMMSQSARHL